jgi:hypothetical protein
MGHCIPIAIGPERESCIVLSKRTRSRDVSCSNITMALTGKRSWLCFRPLALVELHVQLSLQVNALELMVVDWLVARYLDTAANKNCNVKGIGL